MAQKADGIDDRVVAPSRTGDEFEGFDVELFKGQFPILADPGLHYLDNAATAQVPEAVLSALARFETTQRANVHGGVHRLAVAAVGAYESAREAMARYLNAYDTREVIFTYGATSALNLVAESFGESLAEGDEVVLSILEHHSNILPWQKLAARRGVVLQWLPITPDGRLDLSALERVVTDHCRLISVTQGSNVTGAVTEVGRIVEAARSVGAKVVIDGAQRAPHGPVDVQALGIDFYACSGHKMYGPTGIGVLWGRLELLEDMPPFLRGGQMIERVTLDTASFAPPPRRFEAGTPPIAGAVGLGAAARLLLAQDWAAVERHERRLTQALLTGLTAIRGARVIGPLDLHRRGSVVSFEMAGLDAQDICRRLDEIGVALRCGHHCAQPLLRSFGLSGVARASIAPYNTERDIEVLLGGLEEAGRRATGGATVHMRR